MNRPAMTKEWLNEWAQHGYRIAVRAHLDYEVPEHADGQDGQAH